MMEAGYATIKSSDGTTVWLDYPNSEVREFIKSDYLKTFFGATTENLTFVDLQKKVLGGNGNITALIEWINGGITTLSFMHAPALTLESTWLIQVRQGLWCMGADFGTEIQNLYGRSDIVVFIGNTQYVLEFKAVSAEGSEAILAKTAELALQQIDKKKYEYNELARNKGPLITQTVKVALVADTHETVRQLAHMVSQTGDGLPVTARFTSRTNATEIVMAKDAAKQVKAEAKARAEAEEKKTKAEVRAATKQRKAEAKDAAKQTKAVTKEIAKAEATARAAKAKAKTAGAKRNHGAHSDGEGDGEREGDGGGGGGSGSGGRA